jgi:4-hydroxythreonine-4-phosphate dehydrogenase
VSACKRILVTTGDVDGIGLEVTVKALSFLGPQKNAQFIIYRSDSAPQKMLSKLNRTFQRLVVSELETALALTPKGVQLIEIADNRSPAIWVEEAAKACLAKKADAMVTGPLSKQEIQRAGFSDIGHTDILKRISKKKTAFMSFIGEKFNVVLTTGHITTDQIQKSLKPSLIQEVLKVSLKARAHLPGSMQRKPLAVLGLNPHSGDKGLIGQFDGQVLKPILKKYLKRSEVDGPLVPDVAFLPENWKKYSFFVAQYHDQGLIPFKMIHGFDSGVHLTLGLPIKRSSVDHGTAKNIFGKNKANPGSMIEALQWGIRLCTKM